MLTWKANFSSMWATPGAGSNREPALMTTERDVVGLPSSLEATLMPAASLTVKEKACCASVAIERDCLLRAAPCRSKAFEENIPMRVLLS